MNNIKNILYKIFLRSPLNLFDEFIIECQKIYEEPAHNFIEMRKRNNKKIRGDIFEEFCVLYLKHIKKYLNVWLLKYAPKQILEDLKMKRRDMGIDIIAQTIEGNYIAIQCKYKKHTSIKKNILSWRELSTFYALCLRTGPWEKYIIMTNCVYTRHQGIKTNKDISICLKTLQNITKNEWLQMCEQISYTISNNEEITNNKELTNKELTNKELTNKELTNEELLNIEKITNNEELLNIEEIITNNKKIKVKIKKKDNKKILIPSNEELRNLRSKFYNLF